MILLFHRHTSYRISSTESIESFRSNVVSKSTIIRRRRARKNDDMYSELKLTFSVFQIPEMIYEIFVHGEVEV